MSRHIESKQGLKTLRTRFCKYVREHSEGATEKEQAEMFYWSQVIQGCINEGLAMDEVDYELAPKWFRPMWAGLK